MAKQNKRNKNRIFTTYFGKLKEIEEEFKDTGVLKLAISYTIPKGIDAYQLQDFLPPYDVLKMYKENYLNEEEYTKLYKAKVLDKLDINKFYIDFDKLCSKFPVICLICYEKPDNFCHRHLVREWLNDVGYSCKEYVSKPSKYHQLTVMEVLQRRFQDE